MIVVAVANAVANVVSIVLPADSDLRFTTHHAVVWQIARGALMTVGLGVRIWAITVLGEAFRYRAHTRRLVPGLW